MPHPTRKRGRSRSNLVQQIQQVRRGGDRGRRVTGQASLLCVPFRLPTAYLRHSAAPNDWATAISQRPNPSNQQIMGDRNGVRHALPRSAMVFDSRTSRESEDLIRGQWRRRSATSDSQGEAVKRHRLTVVNSSSNRMDG